MSDKKILANRSGTVKLEAEIAEGVLKLKKELTNKLISEIRALAQLQKAEKSAEEFAKILGNNGKDVPKPTPEEAQINKIANELDIEEE